MHWRRLTAAAAAALALGSAALAAPPLLSWFVDGGQNSAPGTFAASATASSGQTDFMHDGG